MQKCKNCEIHFDSKFCPNCGQNIKTAEINFHNFLHDIQHTFHFEKGFFYTLKELILRPGKTIHTYIDGKRINHIKPLTLLILLATAYGIVYHYSGMDLTKIFQGSTQQQNAVNTPHFQKVMAEKLNEWLSTKESWINLILLPIYAIGTAICFRKTKLNFFKHVVLQAFSLSLRLFFLILITPILLYFYHKQQYSPIIWLMFLIEIVFFTRTTSLFFNQYAKLKSIFLSLLAWAIYYFVTYLIGIIIVLGWYLIHPTSFK